MQTKKKHNAQIIKKMCAILLLIALFLNTNFFTIASLAVDALASSNSAEAEKISMNLSYNQLTNKVQNEVVITGVLETDTEDSKLFENPTVYFELPPEVEKVIIEDVKVLYDEELTLGEYTVETNENGNQQIKVSLKGKQTKHQTDGIIKGTNIRVVANIMLKQDIESVDTNITMKCGEAIYEEKLEIVNSAEIKTLSEVDDLEGTKSYANGLLIETKAIRGDTVLNNEDLIYELEIIKYEINVTNTTDKTIDDVKIVANIPEHMAYVSLKPGDIGYGVNPKQTETEHEIEIGSVEPGVTKEYSFELQALDDLDTRDLKDKIMEIYVDELDERVTNAEGFDTMTPDERYEFRKEVVREIALEIDPNSTEEQALEAFEYINEKVYNNDSGKLEIIRDKDINPDYVEKVEVQINTLMKNETISTYNITHCIKINEINAIMYCLESNLSRNKWDYYLTLYRINKLVGAVELNEVNATVTFKLPEVFEIEKIYSLMEGVKEPTYEVSEDGLVTIKVEGIKEQYPLGITFKTINNMEDTDNYSYKVRLSANVSIDGGRGIVYKSNETIAEGSREAVKITQTSESNGEKLEPLDEITYIYTIENVGRAQESYGGYTEVNFVDYIPNILEILDVQYNDNDVRHSYEGEDYEYVTTVTPANRIWNGNQLREANEKDSNIEPRISIPLNIKNEEIITLTIKTRVKLIEEDEYNEIIENKATVSGDEIKTRESNIITNTVFKEEGEKEVILSPENPDLPDDPSTDPTTPVQPDDPNQPSEPTNNTYSITGSAWLDDNENGKIDDGEQYEKGLTVYVYNLDTQQFLQNSRGTVITQKTDNNGRYTFEDVPQGRYYVIIEFDTAQYTITDYQKSDVSELTNCDFIQRQAKLPDGQKIVGITDTIELNNNTENIDIGLIKNKTFDLKMEQFVNKITVTNSKGTKEYNFNDEKFAKIEIHSKQFVGSTVVIEYNIRVTNVGELAGSVNEIVAQIPEQLDFHSELNTDWVKSMSYNLSNVSYRTQEIQPGESIEAKLVLSKTLDDKSAGTFTNTTKIEISENSKHIQDQNAENDTDSTQVLIAVSTGVKQAMGIIGGILGFIVILTIIYKILSRKNISKKTFVIILMMFAILGFNTRVFAVPQEANPNQQITNINPSTGLPQSGWGWDANGNPIGELNESTMEQLAQLQAQGYIDGKQPCPIGHGYTSSSSSTSWVEYQDFIGSDGSPTGDISISATLTITGQSTFIANVTVNDGTGAPGDIAITVECTGGGGSGTVPEGGGSVAISCSGAEFILGATISAVKTCETTYTEYTSITTSFQFQMALHFDDIHSESPYNCTASQIAGICHCRDYEECEDVEVENDDGTTSYEKDCDTNHSLDHDYYQHFAVAVPAPPPCTSTFAITKPVTYTWEDSVSFGPECFPKKIYVNKLDYDTGTLLPGCLFEIDGRTVGSGEEIDMIFVGTHTITEIDAPYGYIYEIGKTYQVTINPNDTLVTVTITNKKITGNLQFKKIDMITKQPLPGVIFEIANLLPDDKHVLEGTNRFTTDDNGIINIYDLLLDEGTEERTFYLKEIYNPADGYVVDDADYGKVIDSSGNELKAINHPDYGVVYEVKVKRQISTETQEGVNIFQTNIFTIENEMKYAKLSGNVWNDGPYNNHNNQKEDSEQSLPRVRVFLHDPVNNVVHETWTDDNGNYVFGIRTDKTYDFGTTPGSDDANYKDTHVLLRRASEYWVEFEYNGVKFRNVELNPDPKLYDVSKASEEISSGNSDEDATQRVQFNERFATIDAKDQINSNGESTGKVIDVAGTEYPDQINYQSEEQHRSSIQYGKNMQNPDGNPEAYGEDIYHIKATTYKNYDFKTYYDPIRNTTGYSDEIKAVNLGLYLREQVDLEIESDLARIDLNVNGYNHVYKYGTLIVQSDDTNLEERFQNIKNMYYQRLTHESTIVYSGNNGTTGENGDVYADVTYKIYLENNSDTLKSKINEITVNYNSELEAISYNFEGEPAVQTTDGTNINGTMKELILNLNNLPNKTINNKSQEVLEVTFRAKADVIATILQDNIVLNLNGETYTGLKLDFMAEIKSYSTYSNNEEKLQGRNDTTLYEYASIDQDSAPRNAQVEMDDQNRFITDTFEDDTTIAPTIIFTTGSQTSISGTVFEDKAEEEKLAENQRLGNGIYDNGESVMSNVKVELLLVPVGANEIYDSTMARDNVTSKHTYEVSKLYKTDGTGKQPLIEDAVTWTDENGNYTFEGVVADNYVIRYTYGENISGEGKSTLIFNNGTQVKNDPIKAREYKSTIITSDYIRKAINTSNDGIPHLNGDWSEGDTETSWFLNDNLGTRYSDGVDDVEYRAYHEQSARLNNENVNDSSKYSYSEMEAYTPYIQLGVEQFNDQNIDSTLSSQENGIIDHEFKLQNIDFGLIERPIVNLRVDKQTTDLELTLGNGQVLIKGDPSNPDSDLPYVRPGIEDFVPIEMDTELINGSTIKQEYTISITNDSELDYPIYAITNDTDVANERNYYYYGEKGSMPVGVRIGMLGDYLTPDIDVDLDELKRGGWDVVEVKDLTEHKVMEATGEKTYRLITEDVEKALVEGKYILFTSDSFSDPNDSLVPIGETKAIKYDVSKLLSASDEMKYTNDVEILEYIGYSQNKDKNENTYNRVNDTTPGNLIPEHAKETDEDSVRTTITPPTGIIISSIIYITTIGTGLIILVIGVIFVKKRVLNK